MTQIENPHRVRVTLLRRSFRCRRDVRTRGKADLTSHVWLVRVELLFTPLTCVPFPYVRAERGDGGAATPAVKEVHSV